MTLIFPAVFIAAVTTAGIFAADNSLGTWKRNVEKTKYDQSPPANPSKSQTTVREASDGGVKVTATGVRMDGTITNATYTLKYDGKPVHVTGSGLSFDTISATQIDANTFTSEAKKTGSKYRTSGKTVISEDGKVMTNNQSGTDAEGKPISFTIVHEKQ
jgi:hypothetical protein